MKLPKFLVGDKIRHIKTGKEYIVRRVPPFLIIEATNTLSYAYSGDKTNSERDHWWVRPQTEMEDGRFEIIK